VEEIIENMPLTVNDLQPHQIHTFYEAVGNMIKVQTDEKVSRAVLCDNRVRLALRVCK
jgi:hypothetical protein